MDPRAVPIPRRMNALQRDPRGYPVPFNVIRQKDGKPCFTVNDEEKRIRCIKEKRCAICGNRLDALMWLVGGPLSAFHPYGAYSDTPLHHDCMQYALQVCPYLAAPVYSGRIDDKTIDYGDLAPEYQILLDHTMLPDRPEVFVAAGVRLLRVFMGGRNGSELRIRPERPLLRVEYWRQGQQLTDEEAEPFLVPVRKLIADGFRPEMPEPRAVEGQCR